MKIRTLADRSEVCDACGCKSDREQLLRCVWRFTAREDRLIAPGARDFYGKVNFNMKSDSKKRGPVKQGKNRELSEGFKAHMFKPGQSGNLAGRPKHNPLSESLRHFLEQPIGKGRNAMTTAEAIAQEILKKARGQRTKADVRAFEAVRDTVEGKPAQRVEIQGGVESKERQRQVRFLSHAVKRTYEDLGAKVTVEEIWTVVEAREHDVFGESVGHLRPAVFAALGIGDERTE